MAVKRLSKIAKELNVGISSLVDHLKSKGVDIESSPNTKVEEDNYNILLEEFADAKLEKAKAKEVVASREKKPEVIVEAPKKEKIEEEVIKAKPAEFKRPEVIGTVDLNPKPKQPKKEEPVAPPVAEPVAPVVEEPKKEEPKKVEPKKEEPKKVEPKKEEPKKEEPKKVEPKKKEEPETIKASIEKMEKPQILGKIDLSPPKKAKKVEVKKEEPKKVEPKKEEPKKVVPAAKAVEKPVVTPKKVEEKPAETPKKEVKDEDKTIVARAEKLTGTTVLGKIELPVEKSREPKGKRKRIKKVNVSKAPPRQGGGERRKGTGARGPKPKKAEITPEAIQKEIKETLARLSSKGGGKKKGDKYRRDKRAAIAEKRDEDILKKDEESKTLQLTEFVTVSDLASLMDVTPTDVISACMSLRNICFY